MIQDKNKLREVGLEPDKPKGHVRGIWALTLIFTFAVVVAGGTYFILWNNPWGEDALWRRPGKEKDQTNGWLTYSDDNLGISIKYPQSWEYYTFSKTNRTDNGWDSLTSFYGKETKSAVEVQKEHPDTEAAYDVALQLYKERDLKTVVTYLNSDCEIKDKKIENELGKELTCMDAKRDNENYYYYVVSKNNNTFVLTSYEPNKDTLDKMVGTFSFTRKATSSPNSPVDTSAWKSYSNTQYGFSLKYSPNSEISTSVRIDDGQEIWSVNFNDKTGGGEDKQYSFHYFDLNVIPNLGNLTANQWINKEFASPVELVQSLVRAEATVDGIRGEKVTSDFGDNGFKVVFVPHGTKMFAFYYGGEDPDLEGALAAFLGNFKFSG